MANEMVNSLSDWQSNMLCSTAQCRWPRLARSIDQRGGSFRRNWSVLRPL